MPINPHLRMQARGARATDQDAWDRLADQHADRVVARVERAEGIDHLLEIATEIARAAQDEGVSTDMTVGHMSVTRLPRKMNTTGPPMVTTARTGHPQLHIPRRDTSTGMRRTISRTGIQGPAARDPYDMTELRWPGARAPIRRDNDSYRPPVVDEQTGEVTSGGKLPRGKLASLGRKTLRAASLGMAGRSEVRDEVEVTGWKLAARQIQNREVGIFLSVPLGNDGQPDPDGYPVLCVYNAPIPPAAPTAAQWNGYSAEKQRHLEREVYNRSLYPLTFDVDDHGRVVHTTLVSNGNRTINGDGLEDFTIRAIEPDFIDQTLPEGGPAGPNIPAVLQQLDPMAASPEAALGAVEQSMLRFINDNNL